MLNALVRKSLIVADQSLRRTRFSMLETIRQFAEEHLAAHGEASQIRAAHSRYFAGREADIMALWDSPRQREAYDWFTAELANLRAAFGGPPTRATSTSPQPSPPTRGSWAFSPRTMSRLPGPKRSSSPRGGRPSSAGVCVCDRVDVLDHWTDRGRS